MAGYDTLCQVRNKMKMISAPPIKLDKNTSNTDIDQYIDFFTKNDGHSILLTADGKKLMHIHGGWDGNIFVPIELAMTADVIICCHPKMVIAKYPELANKVYKPIRNIDAIITTQIVGRGDKTTLNVWAKWK